MKWDKALSTLIVMFLIVNVLLGVVNYQTKIKAYQLSDESIGNIKRILNDKGIVFECDLPKSYRPQTSLWLEPLEIGANMRDVMVRNLLGKESSQVTISKEAGAEAYEQSTLVYTSGSKSLRFRLNQVFYENQAIEMKEATLAKDDALKIAKVFVRQLGLEEHFKNVKISHRIESYGATVTYYEVCNKLPIFDSYIRLHVMPEGVAYAEVQGILVVEKLGTTKPLYSVDKVLFDIEEQISKELPLTIENVQLGYSMNHQEGMHLLEEEAVPVYKIDIKGLNEPIFVNAYTK